MTENEHEIELKPCPFCGGVAEIIDVCIPIFTFKNMIRCTKCGASTLIVQGNFADNEILLKMMWSRRVNND